MNELMIYERFLKHIIVKAGNETLKYYGRKNFAYAKRHVNDIVTKADLASSRIILDGIKKNFRDHGIISEEENDYQEDAEYVWIVDPLDGTLNYSKSIPLYGVMIALMRKKEIMLSGIYMPHFKDLYFASKGKGVYKNGKRIHCSNRKNLKNTWGTIGIFTGNVQANKVKSLLDQTDLHLWFSDLGSISFCSVYAAEGKKDWFIMPSLRGSIWDYAPTSLILTESGCRITDLEGNEWVPKGRLGDFSMIAANPALHKQLLKIMRTK